MLKGPSPKGHASCTTPTWSTCMTAALRAFCAACTKALPSTRFLCGVDAPAGTATLYPVKEISTDPAIARWVWPALAKSWAQRPSTASAGIFSPGREDKELLLLRFRIWLCAGSGHGQARAPGGRGLLRHEKSLDWEVDKFQGFVRFEEHDGCWARSSTPNYILLPRCARTLRTLSGGGLKDHDAVHQAVLLHEKHGTRLLELAAPLSRRRPARGAAVSGAVDAVLQNTGNQSAPQRKRPHDSPSGRLGQIWWRCVQRVMIFTKL